MSKQTIASVTLLLLVGSYLSFQLGQTRRYYTTPPATQIYGVNQVLTFAQTRVDLGNVPAGASQSRTVLFQNRGKDIVVVKRAKASCGCTLARIDSPEIPPGGKGQLVLDFNPALSSPEFAVSISVEYEGRPEIDRLLLSGEVLKPQ